MKQDVANLIDRALRAANSWPQNDETCQYQQFNSAQNTRIHGFSFSLQQFSKEGKEALVSELAEYLLSIKIAAAVDMGHVYYVEADLKKLYLFFELLAEPDPVIPTPKANDDEASQLPLYQRMLELDEEDGLLYQADLAKFQNQSRLFFDNMVDDEAPIMLFLTNTDYHQLKNQRSSRISKQ